MQGVNKLLRQDISLTSKEWESVHSFFDLVRRPRHQKARLIPTWAFAVYYQAAYPGKNTREKILWSTIISLLGPVRLGVC